MLFIYVFFKLGFSFLFFFALVLVYLWNSRLCLIAPLERESEYVNLEIHENEKRY